MMPITPPNPQQNIIPLQSDARKDKARPDSSNNSLNDDEDYSEVGGPDFNSNPDNKHGRKSQDDESIANRGVTTPNPNKEKAI